MRHTSRHKLGIGLTLALAATALSGTSVLAFTAPTDTTTAAGAESILPPDIGQRTWGQPDREYEAVIRSPVTGFNVRVPAIDAPVGQLDLNQSIVVPSPETGLNVRVPAAL